MRAQIPLLNFVEAVGDMGLYMSSARLVAALRAIGASSVVRASRRRANSSRAVGRAASFLGRPIITHRRSRRRLRRPLCQPLLKSDYRHRECTPAIVLMNIFLSLVLFFLQCVKEPCGSYGYLPHPTLCGSSRSTFTALGVTIVFFCKLADRAHYVLWNP